MNKTVLLAGVASALFAVNANAIEFSQYASAKAAFVKMKNDSIVDTTYTTPSDKKINNAIADDEITDEGWGVKLAYGLSTPVKYGKLRGEVEFGWNDDTDDSGVSAFKVKTPVDLKYNVETSVYSVMFNLYYDIDTGTKFTPYVGGGIGYAHVKSKTSLPEIGISKNSSDNNLAWQIGAGVSYALNDNISFDAGYRYTDYGNVKDSYTMNVPPFVGSFDASSKASVTSHEVMLGVRYTF